MGLFDAIKDQAATLLGGSAPAGSDGQGTPALVGAVMSAVRAHGLRDIVQQLQTGGLREAVATWVGSGANVPITAEQLEGALGPGTLEKLAAHVGLSGEQASALLSQVLPHAVDRLTPNGTVEDTESPELESSAATETEATER